MPSGPHPGAPGHRPGGRGRHARWAPGGPRQRGKRGLVRCGWHTESRPLLRCSHL